MGRKDFPTEIVVAVVDGVVAAAVTVHYIDMMIDGVKMRTGGIAGVATRWEYRRHGLATALMRESIKRIKSKGIATSSLFTGMNLPAKRIYDRLGYTETSRWLRYSAIYRPVDVLRRSFEFRGKWFSRRQYPRARLRSWRERVLMDGGDWRATITFDGRNFKVSAGKRGRPTLTMKGNTIGILECFWNRICFDRYLKERRIRIDGSPEAREIWRRIVTMEWVE